MDTMRLTKSLESIDSVLNERELKSTIDVDIANGFNPDYNFHAPTFRGLDALKLNGRESKYLLFEVNVNSLPIFFLRGFEGKFREHSTIADRFLREVNIATGLILPKGWPYKECYLEEEYLLTVTAKGLRIMSRGGGKYTINNKTVYYGGDSRAFGAVPITHEGRLQNLLAKLLQMPAYQGYRSERKHFSEGI